ncbi:MULTISPECIES: gamma-glutamyl-gamma-aminobutyrate hydrolase family protein [unclassified Halanaerobium]|uniref:gamma-glutamyl-gamma-aminobutyrate hydrolase family protein n=1 Tax=unclassified Halanaerobium TaxID=2641197 RepID=UPI000DF233AC|nr:MULTISPECIES: gamma-glutamyl-gamma-aminobutyrate hydrolase family protein [unclassified Halanaerobium]RCW50681.1 putative glutamine amidotransferase [Halanaerobium sp. MA284_MarDTE_T2]RCW86849.1 putative glutamine amidotransferase [Halanaerobium sp. DL-01]
MGPKILIASFKMPTEKMSEQYRLGGVDFSLLTQDYSDSVTAAGGYPFILPYIAAKESDEEYIEELISGFDGIILPGGSDIDPALYNSYPQKNLGQIYPERDRWELKILEIAKKLKKPILGICRGFQLINIYYGGRLKVDVCGNNVDSEIPHMALMVPKYYKTHSIEIRKNTRLAKIIEKEEKIAVNSYHHQAIEKVGKGLTVNAVAPDGIVEAVEDQNYPYLFGVQWHPEMMSARDSLQLRIFEDFINFADSNKNKK